MMKRDEEHIRSKVLRTLNTREKEDRTTKNKMERRMPTTLENYWTESG